jgi:hypothetical protein
LLGLAQFRHDIWLVTGSKYLLDERACGAPRAVSVKLLNAFVGDVITHSDSLVSGARAHGSESNGRSRINDRLNGVNP